MFRSLLGLILFYNVLEVGLGLGMLGPVDLIFQALTECDVPVHIVEFSVASKKFNRSTDMWDIKITTPHEISDDLVIELKGSIKKEGGYKPGSLYLKEPACSLLGKLLGEMFDKLLIAAGVDKCPLPPGYHEALNFFFDNKDFVVPQLYGDYMTEVTLQKEEEVLCCYRFYYQLVSKESNDD